MTYDEAVAELKTRYNAGERHIEVSSEMFHAYLEGLTVLVRTGGRPNQDKRWLAFRLAKVWEQPPCE